MTTHHGTVGVRSPLHKPMFHDISADVAAIVAASGVQTGLCSVSSPHTTCSVIIQEQSHDRTLDSTEFLLQDLLNIFEQIAPGCRHEGHYLHPGPEHLADAHVRGEEGWWSLNTDAHLRSVLIGRSETIAVVGGALELGEFGRVYFVDFDAMRDRERTAHVIVTGD